MHEGGHAEPWLASPRRLSLALTPCCLLGQRGSNQSSPGLGAAADAYGRPALPHTAGQLGTIRGVGRAPSPGGTEQGREASLIRVKGCNPLQKGVS